VPPPPEKPKLGAAFALGSAGFEPIVGWVKIVTETSLLVAEAVHERNVALTRYLYVPLLVMESLQLVPPSVPEHVPPGVVQFAPPSALRSTV
jgi:hypothetical protein